ncbi:uracil/xanthine transporter [Paenibacillus sp. GCM10023252]|uniref:uracil/xanthine transporter n=1 Tax=Paenibacillus sp. GCM10023252 TaxID=3252649 RepID=UPI003612E973
MQSSSFSPRILLAGVQWMFFILTNTLVVPLTLGQAFRLTPDQVAQSVQLSFLLTGAACVCQALFGHRRALMDGPAGIWWGFTLSIAATAGTGSSLSLVEVGGGLAAGYMLAAVVMIVLGLLGFSQVLIRLFNPIVISVFLFLLTAQLMGTFFRGMLGIGGEGTLNPGVTLLSIGTALLVGLIYLRGGTLGNYALLTGIMAGWAAFAILYGTDLAPHTPPPSHSSGPTSFTWFPWGAPRFELGIMLTSFIVGLINMSNTVTSLTAYANNYGDSATPAQYRRSYLISGLFSLASPALGQLPFGTFASSIGLLESTRILHRNALTIGGGLFMVFGLVTPLGHALAALPLTVGSAVLFVAYLQMFGTAVRTLRGWSFDSRTIYRLALPFLLGISIMHTPSSVFSSLPTVLQPLLSNGLIVGVLLSVLLEATVDWTRFEDKTTAKSPQ